MVSTRAYAVGLFIAGLVWVFVATWALLLMSGMSGISEPVVEIPLLLVLYYAAPAVLIVGTALVLTRRSPRLGALLALSACAYLTYLVVPDYLDLLHPKPPSQAPRPYVFLGIIASFVLAMDTAAVLLLRGTVKPSNQAMQRTAGRAAF